VSVDLTNPIRRAEPSTRGRLKRPDRRLRRELARQDRVSARLAELRCIRELLDEATVVVGAGWVQHVWYTVSNPQGRQLRVTAYDIDAVADRPVSGACLVGAVVQAAGGPRTATSQLVQRTLDLTWHTLYEQPDRPVQWCPAPPVRTAHVRDLTRWNDRAGRTRQDVVALLRSAVATADAQTALVRAL
jgi:hypothetical protein